jgi:cytochrome P450
MAGSSTGKTTEILYNPASPANQKNPYSMYEKLRTTHPLYRTPLGIWVTTSAEYIGVILNDKRFGKPYFHRPNAADFHRPSYDALKKWMMFSNPPQHTRIRRLIAKGFARKRLESMGPRIVEAVNAILDNVWHKGEMEFISEFARPLPTTVICDLIGIPPQDRELFALEEKLLTRLIGGAHMSPADLDRCDAEVNEVHDYFRSLLALRRSRPGEDLVSFLITERGSDTEPTDDELAANLFLLFLAGYETTASLLGNALLMIFLHPDQHAQLKNNPALIPQAVSELLRFENSVLHVDRAALEDVEIGGRTIKKGEVIWVEIAAGNRDPALFELPETLNILREEKKIFSFGGGIHRCLGEYLARTEIEFSLKILLDRLPGLHILNMDQPQRFHSVSMRGLGQLHLRWATT